MQKLLVTVVVFGGLLGLAACASQSPNTVAKQDQAKQDEGKTVCFRENTLGTHMPKLHCMSLADYKAYQKAMKEEGKKSRAELQKMQQRGSLSGTGDGG